MREIPAILTAARTSSDSRLEALEAGADALLSKPFTEKDFLHLVHEFLPSQSQ
jgi:CheY-like chemotaxis protein